MKNLLFVFGTRPETIKMSPLILQAQKDPRFKALVCSTGQHREMIKSLFDFFGIKPDFDLDLMKPGQSLIDISLGVMSGLQDILKSPHIQDCSYIISKEDRCPDPHRKLLVLYQASCLAFPESILLTLIPYSLF